jgi:opacity protein-like surface antigen
MTTKFSTVSLAILSIFAVSSANAADVFGSGSTKDGPDAFSTSPRVINWSGVYVGGAIGYGHANHELSLQEYFKDFCAYDEQAANPEFNPFDDKVEAPDGLPEPNAHAHKYTFANVKKEVGSGLKGTDCETATHDALNDAPNKTPLTTVSGDSREVLNLNGLDSSGLVGDVRLGADLQRGRVVFGVFGTYGFNDMTTTVSAAGVNVNLIEKGDEWSAGARLGYLVNDRTMAYILAAYTQSDFAFGLIGANGSAKEISFDGVTVGGGIEFALTQNVFFGIEGTHTFYGEQTLVDVYSADLNEGTRLTDTIGETKVMGTLKVKLNSGIPFTD